MLHFVLFETVDAQQLRGVHVDNIVSAPIARRP
jgi:hypothetical protein